MKGPTPAAPVAVDAQDWRAETPRESKTKENLLEGRKALGFRG